jgi:hypothetical protein
VRTRFDWHKLETSSVLLNMAINIQFLLNARKFLEWPSNCWLLKDSALCDQVMFSPDTF